MKRALWLLLTACAGAGAAPDASVDVGLDSSALDSSALDSSDDSAALDASTEPMFDANLVGDTSIEVPRDASSDGDTSVRTTEAGPWTPPPRATRIPPDARFATNTFSLGGQTAVFHDEGHRGGVFHTYDAFSACGPARRVHVFLPRDYAETADPLPVVYFNDGNTTFWPGGVSPDSWQAAEAISDLRAADRLEPVMLVAIHPLEREREYTHAAWLPGRSCCGVDAYAEQLASCFKPFFDDHYRTAPARAAIVGSSHGGLAAFFAVTRHPDVFAFAGALSPSFWAGLDSRADGTAGDGTLVGSTLVVPVLPLLRSEARPTLWIDWGLVRTGGTHNAIIEALATERGREMVALLEEAGYDASTLTWMEDEAGGHDEGSWARRLPRVLERFAGR